MTKIFLLTVLGLGGIPLFHPLHISVCEMEYDHKRKAIEVTQKIFLDDLELELRKEIGNESLVITELPYEEAKRVFSSYLQRHVKIYLSGSERSWEYLGHEFEQDAAYLYFQVNKVKNPRAIGIMNTVLLRTYNDQVNLVHVEVNGKLKSLKLEGRIFQDEVKFE